jgi:hypothetical protein
MERHVRKHQKEPGHQTCDTASPVDNVRSPGVGRPEPALEYVAYVTHGKIDAIEEESLLNLSARSRFSRLALHEDNLFRQFSFHLGDELDRVNHLP